MKNYWSSFPFVAYVKSKKKCCIEKEVRKCPPKLTLEERDIKQDQVRLCSYQFPIFIQTRRIFTSFCLPYVTKLY